LSNAGLMVVVGTIMAYLKFTEDLCSFFITVGLHQVPVGGGEGELHPIKGATYICLSARSLEVGSKCNEAGEVERGDDSRVHSPIVPSAKDRESPHVLFPHVLQ